MSYGRRGERYRDPPIQIGIATTKKTGLKWRFPSPSPQNIQNVGIGVGGSGARSHFGQRWIAVHSIPLPHFLLPQYSQNADSGREMHVLSDWSLPLLQ